jgi:hypothetical protein
VLDSLDQYNASEIRRRLDSYTKAIFVRHPLERLLSAFRSKFQTLTPKTEYYRAHYGNMIARRYRGSQAMISLDGHARTVASRRSQSKPPVDDITFPEFVRFVAGQRGPGALDRHWKPMSDLCRPSDIQYDFVGRYERLEEDADRLLRRIGANVSFPRCTPPPPHVSCRTWCRAANLLPSRVADLMLRDRRAIHAQSIY